MYYKTIQIRGGMTYTCIMVCVAKKFAKVQLTVRVRPQNLDALNAIGERLMRNQSEMVDRAMEFYVLNGAKADIEATKTTLDAIRKGR